jgi:hypothetical protein
MIRRLEEMPGNVIVTLGEDPNTRLDSQLFLALAGAERL